jgi:DNA-binding transcriptional regulator LsrR (DeoR family)
MDLANTASLKLVGLGTVDIQAQLVQSGMIEAREIKDVAAAGGVGEILGYFFDADGRILDTALSERTLSAALPQPRTERLVALAGGSGKVGAIRAVLRSGSLYGLITDERTAQALLQ